MTAFNLGSVYGPFWAAGGHLEKFISPHFAVNWVAHFWNIYGESSEYTGKKFCKSQAFQFNSIFKMPKKSNMQMKVTNGKI